MASALRHPSTGNHPNSTRPNGVLSIPASATQKRTVTTSPAGISTKSMSSRMKLIVRRLPPGLTSVEFESALGEEWKTNRSKVDWIHYKPGKVSKDPAKPSRPSRAYLHLTKEEHISPLAEKIRQIPFVDAKGTAKDPALLGPPSVEFSPYGRIPSNRGRKDLRQGTIDQDQEFIDFLESLTNPITKPATIDQGVDSVGKAKEKIIVTPLIQFLKDKKAIKGRDTTTTPKGTKHARHDSKDGKITPIIDKKPTLKAGNPNASPEKRSAQAIKIEKAARDVVRIINKQSANPTKNTASPGVVAKTTPTSISANAPLAEKKRERGSASAAAKILQRDLGIGTSSGGRGGRRAISAKPAPNAPTPIIPGQDSLQLQTLKEPGTNVTPASTSKDKDAPPIALNMPPNGVKPPNTPQPPRGPAASRASPKVPAPEIKTSSPNSTNNATKNAVSPNATQAFLKHANPSQGITEPLLEEAFIKYGAVKRVEIDKKKGFAYIDFAEPKGLQEAIQASPIKVAQGQVVVLERKTGPSLQARNARGGSHMIGNRGGGGPMGPRGGRGSSRRGGLGRGGAIISSHNNSKASATLNSSSHANIAVDAAAPTMISAPATSETAGGLALMPNSTQNSTQIEGNSPSDP